MPNCEFKALTNPTLLWLKNSFKACDGNGSAAWHSFIRRPIRGWSAAYPETTGYIIETLLDYYLLFQEKWMEDDAIAGADWLISVQKDDGSFPAGLGTNGAPSVFNSGMILLGLERAYVHTKDIKYLSCAANTVKWLCNCLEENGKWSSAAYISGFSPAYYTRVIWATLKVNLHLQNQHVAQKMKLAIAYYATKINENHSVQDWSFAPGKAAFTHTIAYTMRGFLESAELLADTQYRLIAQNMADRLISEFNLKQKLAGTYDEQWVGDYAFVCVTGNAQLSLNFSRLYQITGEIVYYEYAKKFFESVKTSPSRIQIPGILGGIPGSVPFWGKYMPFQFINWGAKFWLDAALLLETA